MITLRTKKWECALGSNLSMESNCYENGNYKYIVFQNSNIIIRFGIIVLLTLQLLNNKSSIVNVAILKIYMTNI